MNLLMILILNLVSWLQILVVSVIVSGKTGGTWKCTAKCKELTQFEVDTVLEFKSYFEKSLHEVMSLLSMCDDDCPYTHHSKICVGEECSCLYSLGSPQLFPLTYGAEQGRCHQRCPLFLYPLDSQ